MIFYNISNH